MPLVDFAYYQDGFKGNILQEEATFCVYAERASDFVAAMTFRRIHDKKIFHLYQRQIQNCLCVLAEQFFKREIALQMYMTAPENMPKTSETIGAYSVSFANPYENLQEISMTDSAFQASLKRIVLQYLGNTGLLYRGVD